MGVKELTTNNPPHFRKLIKVDTSTAMTLALTARNLNLYGGMAYTKSFKTLLDIAFDLFQQSDLVDDDMSGKGIVCCADRPDMDMMNILDMRAL